METTTRKFANHKEALAFAIALARHSHANNAARHSAGTTPHGGVTASNAPLATGVPKSMVKPGMPQPLKASR
jgi:hypothetical protein